MREFGETKIVRHPKLINSKGYRERWFGTGVEGGDSTTPVSIEYNGFFGHRDTNAFLVGDGRLNLNLVRTQGVAEVVEVAMELLHTIRFGEGEVKVVVALAFDSFVDGDRNVKLGKHCFD